MADPETSPDTEALEAAKRTIHEISAIMEREMLLLSEISDDIRAEALEEYERMPKPSHGGPLEKRSAVGQNERCPCGSGKKFKKNCGSPDLLH